MTTESRVKPPPLVVASALVALQGGVLFVFAILELVNLSSDRTTMGLTTSTFFVAYGAALAACAWAISRGHSWARSPVVLSQLIQLGVAWSFRGGDTTIVAIVLAIVSLVVLAGLAHPASVEALSDNPTDEAIDRS